MDELKRLRELVFDIPAESDVFKRADEAVSVLFPLLITLIESSVAEDSTRAVQLLTSVQQQTIALLDEGARTHAYLQWLLRLTLTLIDTIEMQQATMSCRGSVPSLSDLDTAVSRQIADLDPDHNR